ncbi:MAG TPA: hypothetical protein VMW31_00710 [Devosiaceae bacterium]|nr:hypothetical protein [Devosiaceae bacterium]
MSDLPPEFRHIKLELARETGHPGGDSGHGYDILAPLTADRRIDAELWKANAGKCRVRRFRPDENDAIGELRHGPGGRWFIDYDSSRDDDDEAGFRFSDEKFIAGEYVSIREDDGEMHTFRVMLVEAL